MKKSFKENLRNKAMGLGADLFGIANLELFDFENSPTIPADLTENFNRAVSIAVALPKTIFENINKKPTPEYAKFYNLANNKLDDISFYISKYIEANGFKALPIPASQLIDSTNYKGAITHKAVARLAGIGWQGKSLLLVSPEFGPRIRLATILTDAPVEPDSPVKNRCGKCTNCVDSCPVNSIKNVSVEQFYSSREEALFFDKCKENLTKNFMNMENIGFPICGICIKVCRFG